MISSDVKRHIVIATFVSVLIIVPVMWMLMDRTPPYTIEHVEINPHNAVQGQEIYITFTVKSNRTACSPGLIYREYREESGKLHLFDPIIRAEAPALDNNRFVRISKLPDNISPGPTIYRGTACYTCNPIHSWLHWPVCSSTPNIEFNVVRKPSP